MFRYQKFSFLLQTGLFSCVIVCVCNILIPTITSTKENLVAKIVSDLTLKFIRNQTAYISVISDSSTPEHGQLHKDIIDNFIKLNKGEFAYLIKDHQRFQNRHTFYLFLIESYENFV